jgi:PAS domain S-box-containing protein
VIRFVNRQAEAMFGFDPGELVGQLIEVLVPESFRAVHRGQRQGYVADPKTRKLGSGPELIGRRQDGTEFPLDIGLAHIGSGDDLLVIAAVRDMTARHESEESRRHADRMSAVVEFSGDAIIAGTLDGVITSWNPAAERLFGYTSQEVAGRQAHRCCRVRGRSSAAARPRTEAAQRGSPARRCPPEQRVPSFAGSIRGSAR